MVFPLIYIADLRATKRALG